MHSFFRNSFFLTICLLLFVTPVISDDDPPCNKRSLLDRIDSLIPEHARKKELTLPADGAVRADEGETCKILKDEIIENIGSETIFVEESIAKTLITPKPLLERIKNLIPAHARKQELEGVSHTPPGEDVVAEKKGESDQQAIESKLATETKSIVSEDIIGADYQLPVLPLFQRIEHLIPEHARGRERLLIPEKKEPKKVEDSPEKVAEGKIESVQIADQKNENNAEVFSVKVDSPESSGPHGIFGINVFENGIKVESNTELVGTAVETGKMLTLSLNIINQTSKRRDFVEEFELPEGFSLAFPVMDFGIEPSELYNSLVMISVPRTIPAGQHKISYTVYDKNDQSVRSTLSFSFIISEITDLKFIVDEEPESAIGGKPVTFVGRILNAGNNHIKARLTVASGKGFSGVASPSAIVVAPGESSEIVIMLTPNKEGAKLKSLRSALIAQSDDSSKKILLNQILNISILPLTGNYTDFYRRLPVYLSTFVYGNGNKNEAIYEITAKGDLDEGGKRKLDFFFRPSANKGNIAGWTTRDSKRLEYSDPRLILRLGEHSFNFSRLSGSIGTAEGSRLEYKLTDSITAGFADYTARWRTPKLNGRGFFLAHMSEKIELRLNHQTMVNQRKPELEEKLVSVEFAIRPDKQMNINGEVGKSDGGGYAGGKDQAYIVNIGRSFMNSIHAKLGKTKIGADYGGGLSGIETTTSGVTIPLNKKLTYDYSTSKSEQKPSAAVPSISASEDIRSNSTIRYSLTKTMNLNVSHLETDVKDVLGFRYDYSEKSWRGGISDVFRKARVNYDLERVKKRNNLTGLSDWSTRHRLSSSFSGGSRINYNVFAALSEYGTDGLIAPQNFSSAGINVAYRLLDNLAFNLNYSGVFYKEGERTSRISFLMRYDLADTSYIELKIRNDYGWNFTSGPTFYELAYSKYLGLAVGRDNTIGELRGRVFDLAASEAVPLGDVTVLLGKDFASVTDSSGRYVFGNIAPGSYSVSIDRRSTGLNKIPTVELPIEVSVPYGGFSKLDIFLQEGASLKGTFKIAEEQSITLDSGMAALAKAIDSSSLSGILVEIRSVTDKEEGVYRRLTNREGSYSIEGIPPGNYRFRVDEGAVPDGYKLSRSEGEVSIALNQENVLDFEVSKKLRQIKFILEE